MNACVRDSVLDVSALIECQVAPKRCKYGELDDIFDPGYVGRKCAEMRFMSILYWGSANRNN